ncbi:hypothetical protein [Propionivibrio dicarboxylicus]|uniref:Uncharacterized protein n=1 Tax=Propionivibrio dicarboxylicus TaxID=83767 RepID=A0A1G8FUR9_9RHOO|nr:hypothetical protein [Propionivibrio dicarboxylicus]SDH85889.1 hypothetical protein SAMN05660652_02434 [Propionivibrio dicarboxylicus]
MFAWLRKRWLARRTPTDIAAATRLIHAIDRGGIPLNPAKVNAIARDLGLEVSRRDPVDKTIQRIRQYLLRM